MCLLIIPNNDKTHRFVKDHQCNIFEQISFDTFCTGLNAEVLQFLTLTQLSKGSRGIFHRSVMSGPYHQRIFDEDFNARQTNDDCDMHLMLRCPHTIT